MSKRLLSVLAVFAVAVGVLALARYYASQESHSPQGSATSGSLQPAPESPSPAPELQTPPESRPPMPAVVGDPVDEFNRQAARTQISSTAFSKIARVGEGHVQLRFEVGVRSPLPRNLDDGKSAGFFEPLAQAVLAGDEGAVRMLYTSLKNCEQAPKTVGALRAAEGRATAAFSKTGGIVDGESVPLDGTLALLRTLYERCQGIVPQMYVDALGYLRESAERGDPDNSLLYAQAIATDMPDEAHEILERSWTEHGRIAALDGLSQTSLPHKIANLSARIAVFDGRPGEEGASRIVAEAREELSRLENSTSPSAFRQATEEAARLLSNPKCCVL